MLVKKTLRSFRENKIKNKQTKKLTKRILGLLQSTLIKPNVSQLNSVAYCGTSHHSYKQGVCYSWTGSECWWLSRIWASFVVLLLGGDVSVAAARPRPCPGWTWTKLSGWWVSLDPSRNGRCSSSAWRRWVFLRRVVVASNVPVWGTAVNIAYNPQDIHTGW